MTLKIFCLDHDEVGYSRKPYSRPFVPKFKRGDMVRLPNGVPAKVIAVNYSQVTVAGFRGVFNEKDLTDAK